MVSSFADHNFDEFLNGVLSGRVKTEVLNKVPTVAAVTAWDGKDGVAPKSEHDDIKLDIPVNEEDLEIDDSDL